jgi:hypothetical protein
MELPLVLPATSAQLAPIMRSLDWVILRSRGNLGGRLVSRACLRSRLMWAGIRLALRRLRAIGLMIVIVLFGSVAVPVAILPISAAPEAKA